MKLDILVFAVHPDDAELGCSGTILKHIALGKKVGIIDFTRGELGTRGTEHTRKEEAIEASKILGISVRDNLCLADGFFSNDPAHLFPIIRSIRKYQPEIVLCNPPADRHPDHGRASTIVSRACFLAGLSKIETECNGVVQSAWRPRAVYHFIQDRYIKPDFVVDITNEMEQKMLAIKAYKTQFYQDETYISSEPNTPISSPEFLQYLIGRAQQFGRDIGVKYAEGYVTERVPGVQLFDDLI